MRSLSVALASVAFVGCTHYPQRVVPQLTVQSVPSSCWDASNPEGIPLRLSNIGAVPVSLSLASPPGSPYMLHPWIVEATGSEPQWEHWSVVLEDYARPEQELRMDPGDGADFIGYTGSRPLPGYAGTVVLKVRDTAGHVFASEPLHVCTASSMPNNSS